MERVDHTLKTIQPYFEMVWNGIKPFEVRLNDRDFKVGQIIHLREYNLDDNMYGHRRIVARILTVLPMEDLTGLYDVEVNEDLVILGIKVEGKMIGERVISTDIIEAHFQDLMDSINNDKPKDRSRKDRHCAIVLTGLDKIYAYFKVYLGQ